MLVERIQSHVLVLIVAAIGLVMSLAATAADPIYKSTLPRNELLYAPVPAPDAVRVEPIILPPRPSEAEVEQARQAGQRIKQLADDMESERLAREAAAKARRQAEQARAEQARQAALIEKMKRDQFIMREYYGYRDYRFPPIPELAPPPAAVPPPAPPGSDE